MRHIWTPLLALVLPACQAPEITACEDFIKGELKAPATYQRVTVETHDGPINSAARAQIGETRKLMGLNEPWMRELHARRDKEATMREVTIAYDAENGFGTPVRNAMTCAFEMNGSGSSNRDAAPALARALRDTALRKGLDWNPAYPCCL